MAAPAGLCNKRAAPGEFVASNSMEFPSVLPLFPHRNPRKRWVLISHAQRAGCWFHIVLLLSEAAAWHWCSQSQQPVPGSSPCVSSAPAQIHSCGKTGVVHKKNGLCAESTPGCSAPSCPTQRCQYISTAPWWQHIFFFSRSSCAQPQQVSVQVPEPICPWRGREGSRRPAQEQEDGITSKSGGSGTSRATRGLGVIWGWGSAVAAHG